MSERTKFKMESISEDGKSLKVHIEGNTDMPFWKHDLKFETILSLLETIDIKDFYESDNVESFQNYVDEVQKLLDIVRGY